MPRVLDARIFADSNLVSAVSFLCKQQEMALDYDGWYVQERALMVGGGGDTCGDWEQ